MDSKIVKFLLSKVSQDKEMWFNIGTSLALVVLGLVWLLFAVLISSFFFGVIGAVIGLLGILTGIVNIVETASYHPDYCWSWIYEWYVEYKEFDKVERFNE